jgi:hypothetical protein
MHKQFINYGSKDILMRIKPISRQKKQMKNVSYKEEKEIYRYKQIVGKHEYMKLISPFIWIVKQVATIQYDDESSGNSVIIVAGA